jgi:hypothetical protein
MINKSSAYYPSCPTGEVAVEDESGQVFPASFLLPLLRQLNRPRPDLVSNVSHFASMY